jgi:hypothetical protein
MRLRLASPAPAGMLSGTPIAIRLASGRSLSSRVRRVEEGGAMVIDVAQPSVLREGDRLEVCWSDRGRWFTLNTTVAAPPEPGGPDVGYLRLARVAEPASHDERRVFPRYALGLTISARVINGLRLRPGSEVRALTEDVSLGGIAFETDLELEAGDVLQVALLGDEGQLGGDTDARVVRSTRSAGGLARTIGLEFIEPPQSLITAIRRAIVANC